MRSSGGPSDLGRRRVDLFVQMLITSAFSVAHNLPVREVALIGEREND
jgi:hypothetical protein